jgi:hypothetical protein
MDSEAVIRSLLLRVEHLENDVVVLSSRVMTLSTAVSGAHVGTNRFKNLFIRLAKSNPITYHLARSFRRVLLRRKG